MEIWAAGDPGLAFEDDTAEDFKFQTADQPRFFARFPKQTPNSLYQFVQQLIWWLPTGADRLLWLSRRSRWSFEQEAVVTSLRNGLGEMRPILEAPGLAFESTSWVDTDWDGRTEFDELEDSRLASLMVLLMCFDAEAHVISRAGTDSLYLGDEYVRISSFDAAKLRDAAEMATKWGAVVTAKHPWTP
jgi:hypothetical protein